MKSALIFALFLAVAAAIPAGDRDAQIVSQDTDNIGVGDYSASYQTSNGIQAQQQGQLTNAGSQDEALVVRGSYSYQGPDGQTYTVTYVADQYGFQPQGAHLPQ